jgi:hypothetical protein
MKIGNRVTYYSKGTHIPATITDVAGTGPSGYKTLDLSFKDGEAKDVPHGRDRKEGEDFWLLIGEKDEAPPAPVARRKAVK